MTSYRRPWPRVIALVLVPLVGFGTLFAITLLSRVDTAGAAADDLDGLFSLTAVAEVEGNLQMEATLAYAYGLLTPEEWDEATAATDAAIVNLREEITYYSEDDPIGMALRAVDAQLAGLDEHRAALADGTAGSVEGPYRAMIDSAAAAVEPVADRLVVSTLSADALLALDDARRASSEATLAAVGSVLGSTDPGEVDASLQQLEAAVAAFERSAPTAAVAQLDTAVATDQAEVARTGVEAIAAGEAIDLFAWADVAEQWALAYVDLESGLIETNLAILETRAQDAEDAAKSYAWLAGIATTLAVLITVPLARRLRFQLPGATASTSPNQAGA